ncbi:MAG: mechanosensitive ion channel [Thermotogales bacterium]|nr:mechanosensitive ion channel [Thermotogales bacterium]
MPEDLKPGRHLLLIIVVLAGLLSGPGIALADAGSNPLQPADTSSPRATLQGFIETLDDLNAQIIAIIKSYLASPRLYVSKQEAKEIERVNRQLEIVVRTLNLSETPSALVNQLSQTRILQLKEVLDRIDLPDLESVPDADTMESAEFKHWTLPGTEITIARVEEGPRAGEYLFTPETVKRLPGFYQKIAHLPYKSTATAGWYDRYRYGGGGLYKLIPYRWMAALPDWSKQLVFDQPLWRWFGVLLVLLTATLAYLLVRRLAGAWAKRDAASELRAQWAQLAKPLMLLALIPLVVSMLTENLRVTGAILETTTLTLWAVFTLSLTWAVWLGSHVVAESVVAAQDIHSGSIDSQLIRLGLRLVATILSITILVIGAQHLGIPAYSVLAGLGVGGIAIALAAKDSLANLLGSLLIMFEKPFRVGHWIKLGDTEGIVESIGFRSTRIRTFYNSLVSIPSNTLVNSTVDNMQLRHYRRVRTTLHIRYDTPADTVEAFIEAIKQLVLNNPHTRKDRYRIRLDDFSDFGLQILSISFWMLPIPGTSRLSASNF